MAKFSSNDSAIETLLFSSQYKWPDDLCKKALQVIPAAFQANPVYSWNSTKIIEKQLKILKMRWQIGREL